MWLFTKDGFVSVVKHRDKNGYLVRSRTKEHLKDVIPNRLHNRILKMPNADYRYRIYVSPDEFRSLVVDLIDDLHYPNFKDTTSGEYHDALMKVWSIMRELQLNEFSP